MAAYSIEYNFNPDDRAWVLDGNAVKVVTCLQVTIVIADDTDGNISNTINYLSLVDCDGGTIVSTDDNTFSTSIDAFAALSAKLALPC